MDRKRILLVTGMSGAGTSTTLKTLEDLGWEVVDNLPLFLLDGLLEAAPPRGMEGKNRPLAISIGVRTRDFAPSQITQSIRRLNESPNLAIETLFLNCGGAELKRRYAETRHRHPLAMDRSADDGIAHERALLAPVRDMADRLLDTTNMTSNDLGQWLRANYAVEGLSEPVLTVMSFGFSKGLPRNADLVFDMRFLRNPHWSAELRPGTGLDQGVIDYIRRDPAYETAVGQIETLLDTLVPRYIASGKSYITIAIGCTGGRHRSVHVAERIAGRLRKGGFSPTVVHRDLSAVPKDSLEAGPAKQ
ncbi:RNase adapter RapZ [Sphingomonas sanguinis]|uniref:Nucleotide-binding protein n=1 Tax=Sphingomonas sanguinis TaxID=33051 RepID=A0A147I4J7_9SPHN|nr:RNase adapter RapZ [Sphingomonas sanguinis]KTT73378.1 nucleotide-binding protein [Sphingomonas sanguinis]